MLNSREHPLPGTLPGRALGAGRRRPRAHISGVACSGALILMPPFRRLQNSSSICTPGYGDPPAAQRGQHRVSWLGVQKTTGGASSLYSDRLVAVRNQCPVTGLLSTPSTAHTQGGKCLLASLVISGAGFCCPQATPVPTPAPLLRREGVT